MLTEGEERRVERMKEPCGEMLGRSGNRFVRLVHTTRPVEPMTAVDAIASILVLFQ